MWIVANLPFPPSSNTYYRSIKMGNSCRVLLSKAGRKYKMDVADKLLEQFANNNNFPLLGRLSVNVMLHAPTRRKYDIDNRIKPLLDALQFAGVFKDDECVDHLTIKRGDVIKGGLVNLSIVSLKRVDGTVLSTDK